MDAAAGRSQEAVARGLAGQGVTPVLFGLASTPAMFNSTISDAPHLHCPTDGAIMITGGRLVYHWCTDPWCTLACPWCTLVLCGPQCGWNGSWPSAMPETREWEEGT